MQAQAAEFRLRRTIPLNFLVLYNPFAFSMLCRQFPESPQ
jgi:hypothetical protein